MGKPILTGSALLSASTGGCAAEAAFMWAPTLVVGSPSSNTRCTSAIDKLKAACAGYTLCVVPHHALRSDLGRHSQRRCASRRP